MRILGFSASCTSAFVFKSQFFNHPSGDALERRSKRTPMGKQATPWFRREAMPLAQPLLEKALHANTSRLRRWFTKTLRHQEKCITP
ncbi:hypothetical protein [Nostoc sp. MG11]|uniref:hypothetical protein n=1 Tax=Nostoc sp. MG11 TaxID=2721166 RepID=UPI001866265B|nr:hypothetical protein [Nostoc sp. MG11]